MPVFYQTFNRRNTFSAAPLTRVRHPYRGVRDSHKMNLEADQIYVSLKKLYNLFEEDHLYHNETVDLVLNGGTIEEVELEIDGLFSIQQQLMELQTIITQLEK